MRKEIFRTCLCSRKLLIRESMFRVVKTPNHEIIIDSTYQVKGCGAYLSKDKNLIMTAKKRRLLEKHLKIIDCQNIYDELIKLLD